MGRISCVQQVWSSEATGPSMTLEHDECAAERLDRDCKIFFSWIICCADVVWLSLLKELNQNVINVIQI